MSSQVIEAGHNAGTAPLRYKLLGIVGFAAALVIRQIADHPRKRPLLPLKLVFWGLRKLRALSQEPDTAQAEQLLLGVRWAGKYYPGRVACFEVSLGACIAGTFIRRVPVWCMGVKFDPITPHSWIEVGGNPVAEHESDAWPYQAFERT